MVELICRTVGPWAVNAYGLVCPDTGRSVLIDPGAEPDALEQMLAGTTPVAILITHSHPDHIGGLGPIRNLFNVPVMAHAGAPSHAGPLEADRWLQHGDVLEVGQHHLHVYHTPGHTQDQICFSVQGEHILIVGDTLFPGGPGKTESAGDFNQTLNTLHEIVLAWPNEAVCYPGHGPHFRLGDKRNAIERFLAQDHGAFFGDATWLG